MASCNNCTSTAPLTTFDVQYFYSNQCFDCGTDECTGKINNAKCIVYTGPNLSCSGVNTNDSIETALQKIDEQICSVIGDYSNYQFNCLTAWYGAAITTEGEFVDAITGYACEIADNLNTFITTTFVDYQVVVNNRFISLEIPGTVCAVASLTGVETLQDVLDAYCTQITSISNAIDVSSYSTVWDQCLTVITPPTTLEEAFDLIVDQICQVNSAFVLPTINNIGSCLATPGATDSLVDTISKIKTYLCALPTFDAGAITFGCLTPQVDLQDTIQELVTQASDRVEEVVTYSGDFVVTPNDVMDPCAGVTVSLATPINQDRFVAANVADVTPGTLIDKIVGVGLTVDDVTNPGQITITSTATADNYTVKANTVDANPDFLDVKVNGVDSGQGVAIMTSYNGGTEQVDFTPVMDFTTLITNMIEEFNNNPTLFNQWCTKMSECPCVCTGNCISYQVAGFGFVGTSFKYVDCLSGATIESFVATGGYAIVCAIEGSVTAPDGSSLGGLVTNLGSCAGGTTTTTTTTTTTSTTTTTTTTAPP